MTMSFRSGRIGPLELQRPRQADVAVQVPLVKLVEDDRAHPAQPGVERHLPQQNALGDEADARRRRHARFEPDLVADRLPQRRADLLGHALRQQAGREPPRLQDDHLPFAQQVRGARSICGSCVDLPEPVGACTMSRPCVRTAGDDGGLKFINRQIAGRHAGEEAAAAGRSKSSHRAGFRKSCQIRFLSGA